MSLKTRITSLVTAIANKAEALKAWTVTELDDVYSTIQGVVDAIPTATSELENDAGFLTSIPQEDGLAYFNAGYIGGLKFIVTAEWVLGGIHFPRTQVEITLDTADVLYGRIDVIAVDNTGQILKITGTPKENPDKPVINPISQIECTFVSIPANATTPEGISMNLVYNENLQTAGGEWDTSVIAGGSTTIILNSTASPFSGNVSIEGTTLRQYDAVEFTPPSPFPISSVSQLGYRIKNKPGNYANGDTHRFQIWGTNENGVEQSIVLPLDPNYVSSNSTDYQYLNISIPQNTVLVNITRIRFVGYSQTNKSFGFFLDDIRLADADSEVISGNYASITYVNNKDNAILSLVNEKVDVTDERLINGQTAYDWGDHSQGGYITGISNITEITNRSYNSLQDLPTLNISSWNEAYAWGDHSLEGYLTSFTEIDPVFTNSAAHGILSSQITNWDTAYTWGDHSTEGYLTSISVSDTNINTTKHEIATVDGGSIQETVTALVTPFLDGNELVLKYNNENGVEQTVSVDLSSLNLTDVYAGDMTFDAATNVITVTLNDGVTEYDINLSEFSIVTNTDAFGVTTLAQEATTKLTVSKVGQSGEYTDLLNPPTIPTQTSQLANNSNFVTGQNGITGLWKGTQTEYDNLTPDANTVYYIL